MGLSFSRSVGFGLVRFNFSDEGIGVSVGIPGLRAGIGVRGAYIAGGLGSFRYRTSVSAPPRLMLEKATTSALLQSPQLLDDDNIVERVEHETKSVLELQDSTGDALLKSMNEQFSKRSLWPFAAAGLLMLFALLLSVGKSWPAALHVVIFAVFAAIAGWVYWRDQLGKLTVLFYEPDQATSDLFDHLCSALKHASAAQRLKSIAATSRYADTKYSAGAGQGLQLGNAMLVLGHAPNIVANVPVPVLASGKTTLAFYPDRVLAFQEGAVGAIDYSALSALSLSVRYIENGSLPGDAKVIDRTWQYVNKKGGPDRRFKNNREFPVCAYSQFNLSTPDGLDVRFIGSKPGGFDDLAQVLAAARAACQQQVHRPANEAAHSVARVGSQLFKTESTR